ncbi:Right handed beta helix region [Bartonella schoenbuchensis R1]|uniref:Right handed beta helix region n=2 Tax=Bartonella schoenbuchensis TaxID=165694 RepID=A0A1S6XRU4_BARSR|nr:Right handed beta helix region [Bartonella schoenbuchensis R1]
MLNMVNISRVEMGARVTKGTLEVIKGSIQGTTVGLSVTGKGSATMVGGSIQGGGTGSYGVIVESSGNVTLSEVEISRFKMGVYVKGGTFKMTGGSITGMGNSQGTGIYAVGDDVTLNMVNILKVKTGVRVEKGGTFKMTEGSVTEFTGYGVMVGDGVKSASLMGTVIRGNGKGKGTGVYMEGGETLEMTLERVEIKGVETGVRVERAKSLTMAGGSVTEFTGTGVMVGSEVKSASLMGVEITGGGDKGIGVYAKGGTGMAMRLDKVNISQVEMGVEVEKGVLIMNQGSVTDFTGTGVMVGDGVTSASLTGTTITGGGSGSTGVYARGGNVTLNMVTISKVGVGVEVEKGTLIMNQGSVTDFTGTGVMVGDGVTKADLTRVTITGQNKGTGIHAMGGGTLEMTLDKVEISKVKTGVVMGRGKSLMISGGSIKEVQTGVAMSSGWLTVKDGTKIEFMGDYGVYMGSGVKSASLTGTVIRGNGKGKGTGVYAKGGTGMAMTMTDVRISNVAMGVMMGKGVFKMTGGSVTEFTGTGVIVGDGVTSASLMGAKITGDGDKGIGVMMMGGDVMLNMVNISRVKTGVRVMGGKSLTITGGSIKEVQTGVAMMKGESLMIRENSTINFMGEYGVYVGNGVTKADLVRVMIEGNGKGTGTGIYAVGGTGMAMTMTDVRISKVGVGVYAKKGVFRMEGGSTISLASWGNYGVYVGSLVTNASLMGMRITGRGSGQGVYARGGRGWR